MFVKSITLDNFKRFDHLKIDFPGDVSVIKGPNEQGKSSIVQALVAALFYDPKKINESIKTLKSWNSEKLYKISMTFEAEGENYALEKDFEKKTAVLINEETGEKIDNHKDMAKKMAQIGGYQTPEFFFNSSCVRQGELAFLEKTQNISEALQDIVSGGGGSVSISNILKRVDGLRTELRKGLATGTAKTPGTILRLRNQIAEYENMLREKNARYADQKKSGEHAGNLKEQLMELEEKLEVKKSLTKKFVQFFESAKIIQNLDREHAKIRNLLQAVKGFEAELEKIEKERQIVEKFEKFDAKMYARMEKEIEDISSDMEQLKSGTQGAPEKSPKKAKTFDIRYIVAIILFALAGSFGFFIHPVFYMSFLVSLGILIWAAISRTAIIKSAHFDQENKYENLKAEFDAKTAEMQSGLKDFGVRTIEEAEKKKESLYDLKSKSMAIKSKIDGALGDQTLPWLMSQLGEIEKQISIEELKADKLQGADIPTLEDEERLKRDSKLLETQIEKLKREISVSEAKMTHFSISGEELNVAEEKMDGLKEELASAERKDRMLEVLSETLKEAQKNSFVSTREVVEQYIGKFLYEITGGKYKEISIDPDMKIKVMSSEKGEYVTPEGNLSKGAIEQIYLVARFALIYVLFPRDKGLPRPLVILDDPFGNFDAERKGHVKNILKELSHKFQIIILTCSNEYDDWGTVVDL